MNNWKKLQRELKSLEKKLGKHSIWFQSLDSNRKWELLILWKNHKWILKSHGFEPSLRKFLHDKRRAPRFRVSKQRLRETTLNQIIN